MLRLTTAKAPIAQSSDPSPSDLDEVEVTATDAATVERLDTMDLEVVQPPPLPKPSSAPVAAGASDNAVLATGRRVLTFGIALSLFFVYVTVAAWAWLVEALPRFRALAKAMYDRLHVEWKRAAEHARSPAPRG